MSGSASINKNADRQDWYILLLFLLTVNLIYLNMMQNMNASTRLLWHSQLTTYVPVLIHVSNI